MSIIDDIKHAKSILRYKDRQKVIEALSNRIYYVVEPCVKSGDKFKLFENLDEAMKFCQENKLDNRAFDVVIEELISDGLIFEYTLTERGVYKLCLEK